MSAAWVAGTVRARGLVRRRLGRPAIRALAAAPSLGAALERLARSPYGHDVTIDLHLPTAQRAVWATALWHLRVLAGWLPPAGAERFRLLAGGFEVANIEDHLDRLEGRTTEAPFTLGSLATAWSRIGQTASPTQLRAALRTSAWGDPGGESWADVHLGLRVAWARRVHAEVREAADWAGGALAVTVATQLFVAGRQLSGPVLAGAQRVLGRRWDDAPSLTKLSRRLPADARWVLAGVTEPGDLWLAQARWWAKVESDATRLLARSRPGPAPVVGGGALLAVDAWRTQAALEVAARGGQARRPLMLWRDRFLPERMRRVAMVTPRSQLRSVLVALADSGVVELDELGELGADRRGDAAERLRHLGLPEAIDPRLATAPPDLDRLERDRRMELLAGEAELEHRAAATVTRRSACALAGWMPASNVSRLADRLASLGGAVVALRSPAGGEAPSLVRSSGATGWFRPLVDTYATVPYADVDPSVFAGLAYILMFGMMFGDVGHGALLISAGLALRWGRPARLARFGRIWAFVVGAGVASVGFGLAYGEVFGPTHAIPVLWLAPLDQPLTLLKTAIGLGAVLLGAAYVLGTMNRWREGGTRVALYATSGVAGCSLYAGLALAAAAWYWHQGVLVAVGAGILVGGLVLAFIGLLARSEGGLSGLTEALIELFDATLRLGANAVSFARLAAFGLTHAALGLVVWQATTSLWGVGLGAVGAVIVFLVGNAVAFALEALVAGVQALRLEYYELFSRVFVTEGRPFRPWHIPVAVPEEGP